MTERAPRNAGVWTKLAYGFGAVADGVKNNGFEYFLLLYYGQVLGVDFALVGAALLIAVVFDGISDPIVGYWSDNLRSRLGRRHPFLYAAIIPVGLSFYFVWNPPAGLTGNELFPYLLVMTIIVRLAFTFYEVPATALVAELTDDYDERTSFLSWRYVFGWTGGLIIAVIALRYLLVPTETYGSGFLNLDGYKSYGALSAGVIMFTILVCAVGTHSHIPHLRHPPEARRMTIKRAVQEIVETLSNKSFLVLFMASLLGFMATGVGTTLNYFINGFFWEFTTEQTSILTGSVVFSALAALVIAPLVSRTLGKKTGAIIVGILAFTLAPLPIILRLLGVMPANGTDILFQLVLVVTVVDVALVIAFQILSTSMIADIVEESELRTGRRSEGIFFAGITFIRKLARGNGLFLASLVLSAAQISRDLQPGELSERTLQWMGGGYAFGVVLLWGLMISFLFRYQITRADHEANLTVLGQRRKPLNAVD